MRHVDRSLEASDQKLPRADCAVPRPAAGQLQLACDGPDRFAEVLTLPSEAAAILARIIRSSLTANEQRHSPVAGAA